MGIQPERVMKMSGIGCSSKSPAYFMSRSFSFNGVHGRMPSVATGALLANKTMRSIGLSGDGDTASIGMGQFIHMLRRNVPMIYIVEDNGVYGLTKGQFSATADLGAKLKNGVVNELPAIDICALAIQIGATFVGRSFSGDKKQLSAMLKAAIAHQGTVLLDIISPCVTFNDHEGSTKSYKYMQEHDDAVGEVGFVPYFEDIAVDYDHDTTVDVELHDGSHLRLRKLHEDYAPTDKALALKMLMESHEKGEVLTGVFYVDTQQTDFTTLLNWWTSRWPRCRRSACVPRAQCSPRSCRRISRATGRGGGPRPGADRLPCRRRWCRARWARRRCRGRFPGSAVAPGARRVPGRSRAAWGRG